MRRRSTPSTLSTVVARVNALHGRLEDLKRAGTSSNVTLEILTELVFLVGMLAGEIQELSGD